MLELVSNAEIEIIMYALEELRIDKELLLAEPFFGGIGGVVTQSPEVTWKIAIGGLEARDLVFFWKIDGGIHYQDQLLTQRIKTQEIDVGSTYRGVILLAGLEKTSGDAAKAPVRLEGADDKGKSKDVAGGWLGFSWVFMWKGEWGQFDIERYDGPFAWDGIYGVDPDMLGENRNGA